MFIFSPTDLDRKLLIQYQNGCHFSILGIYKINKYILLNLQLYRLSRLYYLEAAVFHHWRGIATVLGSIHGHVRNGKS